MKVVLAQMKISENLAKALKLIEVAAKNGAQLICFPELQLNSFFPQYEGKDVTNYAISINDEIIKVIRGKCREHKIIAVPNVYLKEYYKYFDVSLVIDMNDEILGMSKMVHIMKCH